MRELENAIERAAILARGESLEPEDLLLEPAVREGRCGDGWRPAARRAAGVRTTARCRTPSTAPPTERVRGALRETGGRRAEAARLLGVERTTLYRLMKRFGIED